MGVQPPLVPSHCSKISPPTVDIPLLYGCVQPPLVCHPTVPWSLLLQSYPTALWVCPASSSLSPHCSMVSPPTVVIPLLYGCVQPPLVCQATVPWSLLHHSDCTVLHMGSSPPVPNPLFYSLSYYRWNPTLQWSLLPNPLFYSLSYYWWNPLFNVLSFFNYHPLFHSLCTFSPHYTVQRSVLNQLPLLIFHGLQPVVPSNNYLVSFILFTLPLLRFHDLSLPSSNPTVEKSLFF